MHYSTKHFPHSLGLSAAYRQWRAASHCRFIHGYPLAFSFKFEADTLDDNHWVMDFGNLKSVKQWLELRFDHKLCVANDDPEIGVFRDLERRGLAQVAYMDHVGCEAFAEMVYHYCASYLRQQNIAPRVRLLSCFCHEHEGNSAGFDMSRKGDRIAAV